MCSYLEVLCLLVYADPAFCGVYVGAACLVVVSVYLQLFGGRLAGERSFHCKQGLVYELMGMF